MQPINIITINILSDLSRWNQRSGLLASELRRLQPDVVFLQEVKLPQNPAVWLADQLGFEHCLLTPHSREEPAEGIATISRFPLEHPAMLDLGSQRRVAQAVQIVLGDNRLLLANGHLFWQPGDSDERLRQVERLTGWLKGMPHDMLRVIGGDFNGTPDSRALRRMREEYNSAFAKVHGNEPARTAPTPLKRSFTSLVRTLFRFRKLIRLRDFSLHWSGTLDYLFVDPRLRVLDCQVVFDRPDENDPGIYPSDHFGIFARIGLPEKPLHDESENLDEGAVA